MNHWHQHSFGHLSDGSRVMLVLVESDFRSRRIPAVLVCRPDGLYRLGRKGTGQLLASGYTWPGSQEAIKPTSNKLPQPAAEKSLGALVPRAWGAQRSSACVIKPIPDWLLAARTANLARLLIAWYWVHQAVFVERVKRVHILLRPLSVLPESPLWNPVAITLVPNTDLVVRSVHSGVLLQRLKLGLERIYISEMAWIRAPKMEATLRALAHRFGPRLVLVKALTYGQWASALKMSRARACEYQFIGQQLQDRYEEDYGYETYDNEGALEGMLQLRIGDIPKGTKMLWIHQMQVNFELWDGLDVEGMLGIEQLADERRKEQSQRASEALGHALQRNGVGTSADSDQS